MLVWFLRIVLVVAALTATGADAHAQTGGSLPPGSWRDSCTNIRWDGAILVADCRDRNGELAYTRADTRIPTPWINCNGDLTSGETCNTRLPWVAPDRLPGGGWRRQPCDFGRYDGSVLVVYCYDNQGGNRELQFDTSRYSGRLDVCGGALRPEAECQDREQAVASAGDGLPGGPWRETCSNPRIEGAQIVANCRENSGGIVRASFDAARRASSLFNCNGRLSEDPRCGGGAASPSRPVNPRTGVNAQTDPDRSTERPLPEGTWREQCHSAQWLRNPMWNNELALVAYCRDGRGDEYRPYLVVGDYEGRVSFCGSFLVAQSGCGPSSGLPGGSWQELCRDARLDGEVLTATCSYPSFREYIDGQLYQVPLTGGGIEFSIDLGGYRGPIVFCRYGLARGTCPEGGGLFDPPRERPANSPYPREWAVPVTW